MKQYFRKPIESTAEILAFKMMGCSVDKRWVSWAYDMLCAGFDTENLVILAGEFEPYNQFELQALTDKIFTELGLNCEDREQVLKNYTCYLVTEALEGRCSIMQVLSPLATDYISMDYNSFLRDFYLLYWAYDDLRYSEDQYYWDGATRANIDEVTLDYFRKFKAECVNQ